MTASRAWLWATVLLTAAAMVSAVVLAPPAGAAPARALAWLLFTGSSVHVASTAWLFTVPAVRGYAAQHTVRCLWVPVSLIMISAAVAAVTSPAKFEWLLLPYFGWQFYQYQKQNIGIASLAASAQRVGGLLPAERWPLLLAGWAGIASLVARPGLLGLRVEPPGQFPLAHELFLLSAATYAIAVGAGGAAIARRPRTLRPCGFCAIYLTCLLFCLPAFAFGSPYAAVGGMTIAHGAQYLLLVTLIAGGNAARARQAVQAGPARLAGQHLLHRRCDAERGIAPAQLRAAWPARVRRLPRRRDGAFRGRRGAVAHARSAGTALRQHASAVPGAEQARPGGTARNLSSAPADRSPTDIECGP